MRFPRAVDLAHLFLLVKIDLKGQKETLKAYILKLMQSLVELTKCRCWRKLMNIYYHT